LLLLLFFGDTISVQTTDTAIMKIFIVLILSVAIPAFHCVSHAGFVAPRNGVGEKRQYGNVDCQGAGNCQSDSILVIDGTTISEPTSPATAPTITATSQNNMDCQGTGNCQSDSILVIDGSTVSDPTSPQTTENATTATAQTTATVLTTATTPTSATKSSLASGCNRLEISFLIVFVSSLMHLYSR